MKKENSNQRGRKNVEKRLIDSAAYLVGSVGPNQLTIRDIAEHAGVNHAQIHHYFGGKKGLLIATYKQLAFDHVQQLERRNVSVTNLGTETLSSVTDDYFKAIIRAVLDDQMYLVRVQIDSNLSMSRQTLQQLTKIAKLKKPNAEAKAAIAIVMCLEFGLAAMETYIEEVLEMSMSDKKVFMDYFFEARQLGISKLLK
tara:strand:- start:224 stop:817 length:594 start_codon:yes stop_codon:yes gene_type:complete